MMWLELNLAVQSWVSSVKSSGLSTQPCGAPVLSVVVLEVLWPTRTDWGLPVKKSRIQLQRELLRPSRLNLLMSCCGIIVLNAELKSMNSILTYESLFSRWVRAAVLNSSPRAPPLCIYCMSLLVNTPDSYNQLVRSALRAWTVFRLTCSLHSVHWSLLPEQGNPLKFTSLQNIH